MINAPVLIVTNLGAFIGIQAEAIPPATVQLLDCISLPCLHVGDDTMHKIARIIKEGDIGESATAMLAMLGTVDFVSYSDIMVLSLTPNAWGSLVSRAYSKSGV